MIYDVRKYGATGDGTTNDAPAIQQAIDDCSKAGGGRVLLTGGFVYSSGSLWLKDNVELHLEQGARLVASKKLEDFACVPGWESERQEEKSIDSRVPSYVNCEFAGEPKNYFIFAENAQNVCVSGQGTIDGSEEIFYGEVNQYHIEGSYYPRIPLFLLKGVHHLTIRGVTLTRSAFWTVHMVGCRDVLIDGIRILNNLKMANCDGIDPDHCQNVRIANCHIECADDCIVFKNSARYLSYGPCENIVVTNCTLTSTSSAIKFGTESEALFHNIAVTNCVISNTNRAISLQLRDCGSIENVIFSNINIETRRFSDQWWGKAEPIYVTAINRKQGVQAGHIKNICFENINCYGEAGIFLHGSKDNRLQDVLLRHIRVVLRKTSKWPADHCDLRPCEGSGLIPSAVNGLYANEAEGLHIEDVQVCCEESMKPYYGKDFVYENTTLAP